MWDFFVLHGFHKYLLLYKNFIGILFMIRVITFCGILYKLLTVINMVWIIFSNNAMGGHEIQSSHNILFPFLYVAFPLVTFLYLP